MAEVAVVVTSRQQLATRLANWPDNEGEQSWGLVFCGGVPTASELMAMREASRLVDRLVCVRLFDRERPVAPQFDEVLRGAGVDLVWVPKDVDGPARVDLGVDELGEEGATLLLQAVMHVMPLLVVVPRNGLSLVRACRNIQASFGDSFSLRIVGESS
ncbi:MAG: hypothetical protein DI628_05655 [Blastochloris viridis]|uniref:Uncharacterized protein n=1 Tax=Blastochloris viridis TaxID=1079 RepID=A0A6N4RAU9_BLAVI|nr:MAG: hypothetical protein DI628_05655 [Blastochloris viridis]